MHRALDSSDIKGAYNVACLGATEADWKLLAVRALRGNCLDIAKNAFARLKDMKYLSLIETIERGDQSSSSSSSSSGGHEGVGNAKNGVIVSSAVGKI